MLSPPSGDICPIGVFDSGIGGLSVLKEIHQLLPNENLIYIGDSAKAPYGDRSAEFVRQRSIKIANILIDQGVKAIVIACNTATAEAAERLRETVDIPIIGLEPAVKPAAELSKNGIIGVLATQRTISSDRLLGLAEKYARNKKVIAQACPGLVEQVEACQLTGNKTERLLRKYIQPLLKQGTDTLILGCTHYPFLLPTIKKIVNQEIQILETGRPVAEQLSRILNQYELKNNSHCKSTLTFYNTSANKKHQNAMINLWEKVSHHTDQKITIKDLIL